MSYSTPIRQRVVLCRMSTLENKLLKEWMRRFIGPKGQRTYGPTLCLSIDKVSWAGLPYLADTSGVHTNKIMVFCPKGQWTYGPTLCLSIDKVSWAGLPYLADTSGVHTYEQNNGFLSKGAVDLWSYIIPIDR